MTELEQEVTRICEEHASGYDSGMQGFMSDLRRGGCVSGIIGALCYYSDTNKFHDDFESDIWDLLSENAEEQGMTIPEFIASLNGADNVGSIEQHKNLLAWFAFEETAFRLFDKDEED